VFRLGFQGEDTMPTTEQTILKVGSEGVLALMEN